MFTKESKPCGRGQNPARDGCVPRSGYSKAPSLRGVEGYNFHRKIPDLRGRSGQCKPYHSSVVRVVRWINKLVRDGLLDFYLDSVIRVLGGLSTNDLEVVKTKLSVEPGLGTDDLQNRIRDVLSKPGRRSRC